MHSHSNKITEIELSLKINNHFLLLLIEDSENEDLEELGELPGGLF